MSIVVCPPFRANQMHPPRPAATSAWRQCPNVRSVMCAPTGNGHFMRFDHKRAHHSYTIRIAWREWKFFDDFSAFELMCVPLLNEHDPIPANQKIQIEERRSIWRESHVWQQSCRPKKCLEWCLKYRQMSLCKCMPFAVSLAVARLSFWNSVRPVVRLIEN